MEIRYKVYWNNQSVGWVEYINNYNELEKKLQNFFGNYKTEKFGEEEYIESGRLGSSINITTIGVVMRTVIVYVVRTDRASDYRYDVPPHLTGELSLI